MTSEHPGRVCAIVVTYNRAGLLFEALSALEAQVARPDHVFVMDNASTDGSSERVAQRYPQPDNWLTLVSLSENTGGAGGFAAGMQAAMAEDYEWLWMMDDDARPHPDALERLMAIATDSCDIYGSLAVNGSDTSWPITLLDDGRTIHAASAVPVRARVEFTPLLGFLIHRSLAECIGYPEADFFIAADDVEYCLRARRAGADIIIAGQSRIEHPRTVQRAFRLFGTRVVYLSLAPWKRYYDTRNRLLIARKYYGIKLWTQTVPGSCVRLLAALLKEPRKLAQLKAWCCGMIDGLLGIKGKRHEKWGIRP